MKKNNFAYQHATSIASLVVAMMLLLVPPALAQEDSPDWEFFEETGHWVNGQFLEFFHRHGGLEIFGYPLTEPFEQNGFQVQYFQNARMEWHPGNPDPYKVQLGLLGDELNYRKKRVPPPTTRSARKVYFPETGHTVAYAFLDYFKANGGIDVFGYPISEMFFENGKVAQYFQRMKMVWDIHEPNSQIMVGNLGEVYVNVNARLIPLEARQPLNAEILPTLDLQVVVELDNAVISSKRRQGVSVLVLKENGEPLSDALVEIHLETPAGRKVPGSERKLTTNESGRVYTTIPLNDVRPGTRVTVSANVTYDRVTETAENLFLVWW